MRNATRILVVLGLLSTLLFPLSAAAQRNESSLSSYGAEQLTKCFTLTAEDAELVLGEAVDPIPTVDESNGYCTYASLAANDVPSADDLFPTYGPKGEHQYLAVTLWPAGSATDPWMYLAYAILDRDHGKFGEFMGSHSMTDLEALATVESGLQNVTRQYLPDLAEGALWYWQETSTGHHLAGIYAVSGEQRVAAQALVKPEQGEEDVQQTLSATVEKLAAENAPASGPTRPAPVIVDGCPSFSHYDAAAILQEPANPDAPIGNILFGPLPEGESNDYSEVLKGLCGYTNYLALPPDAVNPQQTHLLTDLPYSHVVATGHLTGEILHSTNGTMQMAWMEMIALAEVVAAANPKNDGKVFDYLYGTFNIGDFASWTDALEKLAKGSPSFKVTKPVLPKGDPRDELLWLWQTLDDGHFSLLISRQGNDFDVVAALLGSDVPEKSVLAYSKAALEKMMSETQPVSHAVDSDSENFCMHISDQDASELVGEPVLGHAVKSSEGEGCKYTPSSDRTSVQPNDFSPLFQTFGLLAGVVPPKAAQRMIQGMVEELSTTGRVTDGEALGGILTAIKTQDFATALQQMGMLEWISPSWQVEALTEVDEQTLLLHGKSGNGWNQFFLLRKRGDGGIYYLSGVLSNEIIDVRDAIVAVTLALGNETMNGQSSDPAQASSAAEMPSTASQCNLFSTEAAQAITGVEMVAIPASGDRGEGCSFIPITEYEGARTTDFAPQFHTQGILSGVMTSDGVQNVLTEFLDLLGVTDRRILRAIDRGELANALRLIARLQPKSEQWQIEPVAELGESAIWIHGVREDDSNMAMILVAQKSGEIELVLAVVDAPANFEAVREVVVGEFLKTDE